MPATRSTRSLSTEAARAGRQWYIADARDQVLGRLATRIAATLRGKHRATFTPHVDAGDFVIVVNAEAVRLTGSKENDKRYHATPDYPGGVKTLTAARCAQASDASRALRGRRHAAEEPARPAARDQAQGLRGPDHPHQAQRPVPLTIS
jgi:large subunit ribosomal protein L13